MYPSLYTGASGLIAGERTIEIVSNNLANSRTLAFKPERPLFASYLNAALAKTFPAGQHAACGGVALATTWNEEGKVVLRETRQPYDMALHGDGWFRIGTPDGERLTRAGAFTRSEKGTLVTLEGYSVLDTNGKPITIPEGQLVVAGDGTLSVDDIPIGKLGLAKGSNAAMTREGGTLWNPQGTIEPLDPKADPVRQGYLEDSGVQALEELVDLIAAQRHFEFNQRMVDLMGNTVAKKAIELGAPR